MFRHEGEWYVYDAGSNRLLRVDDVVADVLEAWRRAGSLDAGRVPDIPGHPPAEVTRALAEITSARERGLFLPVAPVPSPPESGSTDRLYAEGLQHLVLTVAEDCNLRCRYCLHESDHSWIRSHRPRLMAPATAVRAVEEFLERTATTEMPIVSFYGGEPLLNRPVIEAVCARVAAHPRGGDVRLVIDTNGLGLAGAADLVRRHGLFLQVSLDGPAPVHDRYRRDRRGRPTHRRIEENLTRLLAAEPALARRLRIQVTLMPDVDLEALDAYFADFPPFRRNGLAGTPSLGVTWADLGGIPLAREVLTDEVLRHRRRQLAAARDRFVAACREGRRSELGPVTRALFEPALITWHHRERGPLPATIEPSGCCLPGIRKLHVRPDGALQPCERVGETMALGTVETWIDAAAVWDLWERFVAATGERCRSCWAIRHCRLCFTALAPGWGETPAPMIPEAACRAVRRRLLDDLRLHLSVRGEDGRGLAWLRNTSVA